MNKSSKDNIVAIIQARMNSKRFPGKVLHKVNGKTILQYIVERVQRSKYIKKYIIATSDKKIDDPIDEFCNENNILCFRGDLYNVAKRFYQLLCTYKDCDAICRICGDSPLLDINIIAKGIRYFLRGNYDMVTNIFPRTFPKGQSFEIFNAFIYKRIYQKIKGEQNLEHVTKYFYENSKDYKIFNYKLRKNLNHINLSIDTRNDFKQFKKIILKMKKPHWNYNCKELIELLHE